MEVLPRKASEDFTTVFITQWFVAVLNIVSKLCGNIQEPYVKLFEPDVVLNLVVMQEAYTNLVGSRHCNIKIYLAG